MAWRTLVSSPYCLLCFLVAAIVLHCPAFGAKKLAPHVVISPNDREQKQELRRVLFGGEPHLIFCSDERNTGVENFVQQVREEIGKKTDKIRTALVHCEQTLPTSGKTLRQNLKLKKGQAGEPIVVWSSNGDKPKQLTLTTYTSQAKKKTSKGKQKSVPVQLDAKKLSDYALKARVPKIKSIASNESIRKHCFSRKYQLCGLLLKKGKLSKNQKKFWVKASNLYRSVRFFTIDTSLYMLKGIDILESSGAVSLLLFRSQNYVYSGPQLASEDEAKIKEHAALVEAERIERKKFLSLPVKVEAIGPRVRVSYALKDIRSSFALESSHDPLPTFRKHEVESSADIDFAEIDKSNIVILIRTGEKGFLLDWDAGSFVLLNQASFGHDVGVSALADLQYQSLSLMNHENNKPDRTLNYLPFAGNIENGAEVSSFLKSSLHQDVPMNLLSSKPSLTKSKKSKKSSRHTIRDNVKRPSKKDNPDKVYKKRDSESKIQVERERQRRMEMEREAVEVGAIALEADEDDDNCEDTSDVEYDDIVDLDEETNDSEEFESEEFEDGEEDELNLDDF
mmetsp:Transcript_15413/g.17994  ORF Transcript_15413/g.17994 Transcript_15413/m.17994 type:complete len:565 (+) Transcript_15413:102-1796(+)